LKNSVKSILLTTVGAASLFVASANANASTIHKVVNHDTVWDISQKYGVSIKSIEKLNHISSDSHLIYPNQDIKIPSKNTNVTPTKAKTNAPKQTANTSSYVVKAGDSLWTIAQAHKTSVSNLRKLNNLSSIALQPGQTLKITGQVVAVNGGSDSHQTQVKQASEIQAQVSSHSQQSSVGQVQSQESSQAKQATVSQNHQVRSQSQRQSNATVQSQASNAQSQHQSNATVQSQASNAQSQHQSNATVQSQASNVQTQRPASTKTVNQPRQSRPQSSNVKSSANGGAIVSAARALIGSPYAFGGSSKSGFDCSGLTQFVFAQFGKSLPHSAAAQENSGRRVALSQAQPGDLIIGNGGGHVGIYTGNGNMVSAENPNDGVKEAPIKYFAPMFAVRVN